MGLHIGARAKLCALSAVAFVSPFEGGVPAAIVTWNVSFDGVHREEVGWTAPTPAGLLEVHSGSLRLAGASLVPCPSPSLSTPSWAGHPTGHAHRSTLDAVTVDLARADDVRLAWMGLGGEPVCRLHAVSAPVGEQAISLSLDATLHTRFGPEHRQVEIRAPHAVLFDLPPAGRGPYEVDVTWTPDPPAWARALEEQDDAALLKAVLSEHSFTITLRDS